MKETMREKAQKDLEFMPEFLEAACEHSPGSFEAIQDTAAWSGFMAPFSPTAVNVQIEADIYKRLKVLIPVLREKGDEDVAKTFVALLMWSTTQNNEWGPL